MLSAVLTLISFSVLSFLMLNVKIDVKNVKLLGMQRENTFAITWELDDYVFSLPSMIPIKKGQEANCKVTCQYRLRQNIPQTKTDELSDPKFEIEIYASSRKGKSTHVYTYACIAVSATLISFCLVKVFQEYSTQPIAKVQDFTETYPCLISIVVIPKDTNHTAVNLAQTFRTTPFIPPYQRTPPAVEQKHQSTQTDPPAPPYPRQHRRHPIQKPPPPYANNTNHRRDTRPPRNPEPTQSSRPRRRRPRRWRRFRPTLQTIYE